MDEINLINQFRQGNEQAFRHIFDMFNNRLCFFADGILHDPSEAEDIVQDAFVKLWDRRWHFRDYQAIKAFLYLSIKNACRNYLKHAKVIEKYLAAQPAEVDEDSMMRKIIEAEVLEEVYQALQMLPEGCRKVVNLSYFQGLSNQEVADQLHISVNTVKTQKLRALRTLRVALKEFTPILALLIAEKL